MGADRRREDGRHKGQLEEAIRFAQQRAATRAGNQRDVLADELSRIKYVFRGSESDYPGLRAYLIKQVAKTLPPDLKPLASRVNISFRGKGVPF